MTTTLSPREAATRARKRERRWARLTTRLVGGVYLIGAAIHVGVVAADAQTYRPFADGAHSSG